MVMPLADISREGKKKLNQNQSKRKAPKQKVPDIWNGGRKEINIGGDVL